MWNGVTDILKCTQVDMVGGLGSEGDLDQRKGVEQGDCDTRQGFSLWYPGSHWEALRRKIDAFDLFFGFLQQSCQRV